MGCLEDDWALSGDCRCLRGDAESRRADWVIRNGGLHEKGSNKAKGTEKRRPGERGAAKKVLQEKEETKDCHYSVNALDID